MAASAAAGRWGAARSSAPVERHGRYRWRGRGRRGLRSRRRRGCRRRRRRGRRGGRRCRWWRGRHGDRHRRRVRRCDPIGRAIRERAVPVNEPPDVNVKLPFAFSVEGAVAAAVDENGRQRVAVGIRVVGQDAGGRDRRARRRSSRCRHRSPAIGEFGFVTVRCDGRCIRDEDAQVQNAGVVRERIGTDVARGRPVREAAVAVHGHCPMRRIGALRRREADTRSRYRGRRRRRSRSGPGRGGRNRTSSLAVTSRRPWRPARTPSATSPRHDERDEASAAARPGGHATRLLGTHRRHARCRPRRAAADRRRARCHR